MTVNPIPKSVSRFNPPPGPERRLPILLRQAWYGLNQAFRRRIQRTHLTPDQFTVMRNLAESGARGLTQTQLTRQMSSDPNTITALVTRMERQGLVERATDPDDRRARRLTLRPEGMRQFRRLRQIARQLQDQVLASLPPGSGRKFLAHLATVAEACRMAALEESPPRPRSR
jgi:DNA-binding MarR family transcriptional regulator